MAKSKKKSESAEQMALFDRPPKSERVAGKGNRKRKRAVKQGEVRTYKSKSGHTYELRRVE